MKSKKVVLPGSERQPIGKRVGDQPDDEIIEVSGILKPKARAALPGAYIVAKRSAHASGPPRSACAPIAISPASFVAP